MQKTIYLIRHAHIDTKKQMIGCLDLPLSEKGMQQAHVLRMTLSDIVQNSDGQNSEKESLDKQKLCIYNNTSIKEGLHSHFQNIYVSPLLRTRQTANIIFANNPKQNFIKYLLEPHLQEISLGEWEGLQKEEILCQYPEIWKQRGEDLANTAPPKGESFACLQKRVIPCFNEIVENMNTHLPVIIVAHQAVNRVILGFLQGIDLQNVLTIAQDYACVTRIQMQKTPDNTYDISFSSINKRSA